METQRVELERVKSAEIVEIEKEKTKQIELKQQHESHSDNSDSEGSEHSGAHHVPHFAKHLPRLPNFNSKHDDVLLYLNRFESYAEISNWKPERYSFYLSLFLDRDALLVYNGISQEVRNDYFTVKKILLLKFNVSAHPCKLNLFSAKPLQGESIEVFLTRLNSYFENWLMLSNTKSEFEDLKNLIIREAFLGAMPEDLRLYLVERNPESSAELVKLADNFIMAKQIKPLIGLSSENKDTQNDNKHSVRCWNCNGPHYNSECMANAQSPSQANQGPPRFNRAPNQQTPRSFHNNPPRGGNQVPRQNFRQSSYAPYPRQNYGQNGNSQFRQFRPDYKGNQPRFSGSVNAITTEDVVNYTNDEEPVIYQHIPSINMVVSYDVNDEAHIVNHGEEQVNMDQSDVNNVKQEPHHVLRIDKNFSNVDYGKNLDVITGTFICKQSNKPDKAVHIVFDTASSYDIVVSSNLIEPNTKFQEYTRVGLVNDITVIVPRISITLELGASNYILSGVVLKNSHFPVILNPRVLRLSTQSLPELILSRLTQDHTCTEAESMQLESNTNQSVPAIGNHAVTVETESKEVQTVSDNMQQSNSNSMSISNENNKSTSTTSSTCNMEIGAGVEAVESPLNSHISDLFSSHVGVGDTRHIPPRADVNTQFSAAPENTTGRVRTVRHRKEINARKKVHTVNYTTRL